MNESLGKLTTHGSEPTRGFKGRPHRSAGDAQLRLFLVADNSTFFQSEFLDDFLRSTPDAVVGAAVVTRIPEKHSLETYLRKHWFRLRPTEIALLLWGKYSRLLNSLAMLPIEKGYRRSVRTVLSQHQIPTFDVTYDINQPRYLEAIQALTPDVIVASCSLIFGRTLLEIPTHCCVNRHSGLLPDYRGLWPVFHAYRSGEPWTGSTIHVMEPRIDRGQTLAQGRVRMRSSNTLHDLYHQCFLISSPLLLEALDRVRNNEFNPRGETTDGHYYSFPTREHWRQFRERGGKLI